MSLPTADDVAHAIVAACRETGEDPIATAMKAVGVKARHYALQALGLVFRDAQKRDLAELVGCPGKGSYFYKNSMCQVVGRAPWWDRKALERVIDHVKANRSALPKAEPDLGAEKGSEPNATPRPAPPAGRPSKPGRQVVIAAKKSGRLASEMGPPSYVSTGQSLDPGKRKLHEMLAEAVRNTAAMTRPEE